MNQIHIPVMGTARRPSRVEHPIIDRVPNAHQALLLAWQLSGMTDSALQAEFEIGQSQFSRIRTGIHHFPTHKLGWVGPITGNTALSQYLARCDGFALGEPIRQEQRPNWLLESA